MNVQEEIKNAVPLPSSPTRMLVKRRLQSSCSTLVGGDSGSWYRKGKKTGNFAKSDWMDIEKQRGISVTSSVMQFDYDGKRVNILDTQGTRTSQKILTGP